MSAPEPDSAAPFGVSEMGRHESLRDALVQSHRRVVIMGVIGILLALGCLIFVAQQLRAMVDHRVPALLAATRVVSGIDQSTAALRSYLTLQQPPYRAQWEEAWAQEIEPGLDELDAADAGGYMRAELGSLRIKLEQLRVAQTQVAEAARDAVHPSHIAGLIAEGPAKITPEARRLAMTIVGRQQRGLAQQAVRERRVVYTSAAVILGAALVMAFVARLVALRTATRVVGVLQALMLGMRELAEGTRREDLVVDGRDELHQIAKAFNALRISLALAEMKYRSLFSHTSNSMVLAEPVNFRIQDVNLAFERLLATKKRALYEKSLLGLFPEARREEIFYQLREATKRGKGNLNGLIVEHPEKGPRTMNVSISIIRESAQSTLELTFVDVTEQQEQQKELSEFAFKDALTKLYNQRAFYQRLEHDIAHAHETGDPLSLVFIDLDNFKHCNDTYGHQAGDRLLQLVGDIILRHIRSDHDAGFRYGGDEFGILLVGATSDVSRRIAERVHSDFDKAETYGTSMSLGITQLKPGEDAPTFVKSADVALYAAKSGGKNTIRVAS